MRIIDNRSYSFFVFVFIFKFIIYESNSQTLQTVGGLMFKWGRAGEVGPPSPAPSRHLLPASAHGRL